VFKSFPVGKINSLTPMELDVLRYINNNKNEILNLSIQELARNLFVSTTTIIRLCKKLDLEGYSHMKYFIRELLEKEKYSGRSISPLSIEEIIAEELSDIEQTARGIDINAVHEIAEFMKHDNQIHFFAKGLTNIVFNYAARHLLSLSRHVTLYEDTHIAYIQSEYMSEKDIIFLASLSGETEQVVRVAQIAKSKGAKVITFTSSPSSMLSKASDYNFLLVNNAKTTLDVDTRSRCQLMFILNIIIKSYAQLIDREIL
jgi:DNA-binding MurR/RpiR family transcriptional regulator